MRHQTSIFADGALLVPDFITAAEEERILLRISHATRGSPSSAAACSTTATATTTPATPPRTPATPLPGLGHRHGGPHAQALRGRNARCSASSNEYLPGQTIGMHADHAQFGPVVASLSLAAMTGRCGSVPAHAQPYARGALPGDETAVLPRRSLLVLAGAARHRWMHGIARPGQLAPHAPPASQPPSGHSPPDRRHCFEESQEPTSLVERKGRSPPCEPTALTRPARFRFSRAEWGEFSNFYPLPAPIPAGPWLFPSSEHLYQAAKFSAAPDVQAAHRRSTHRPRRRPASAANKTLPADPLAGPSSASTSCAGCCAANSKRTRS